MLAIRKKRYQGFLQKKKFIISAQFPAGLLTALTIKRRQGSPMDGIYKMSQLIKKGEFIEKDSFSRSLDKKFW